MGAPNILLRTLFRCTLSRLAVTGWVSFPLMVEKRTVQCGDVNIREHPCVSGDWDI